jgi:uncharacterized damage-inducible protein DinB
MRMRQRCPGGRQGHSTGQLTAGLLMRFSPTIGTAVLRAAVFSLLASSPAAGQGEPVVPPSLKAGLLARFDESSGKVVQLAKAIPPETYSWRPATGVRSISEVLVHIALGNYYTTMDAGAKPAIRVDDEAEKTLTRKAEVVAFLQASNSHMHDALGRLRETDLRRPTTMFGQSTTYQNVYLFGISHVHEHLGQLVAYARMNGVTPPWTQPH